MVVSIIPIGNSKGIRIPKAVLDQLDIKDKLELEVEDKQLILRPVRRKPREGWDDSLRRMSELQDDALLVAEADDTEVFDWEW